MFIKLLASLFELLIPRFMQIILDVCVPKKSLRDILIYGILMVVAAIFALVGNIIANRMSAISAGRITKKLRHDLFEKLQSLSSRQIDKLTVSSAESRLTSDTYNFNQFFARFQRMGIRAPIMIFGGLIMMFVMDPVLALVLLALMPVIVFIVYAVTKKSVPLYTEEQSILDKVVRVLQENITGIRVIKALCKTEHEKKRFNEINEELNHIDQKVGFVTSVTNPSTSLVLNIGLTLVVLVGAYRVNGGSIQSGVIIAFLQYFVMILNALLGITRTFIIWSKSEASASRIADVLSMDKDLAVLPFDENKTESAKDVPHIEFRNVCFSYTGIGKNLNNINFKLYHGESLGIIGETGSGKSTVMNLLLRLYDTDEGEILIDGRNIKTIPYDTLRSKFGIVFQNDFVAEGTIKDNIKFFRDIDDEKIKLAAQDAQASEFIAKKENGLDSAIAIRGNNISGGQKQRLLIARALAGDPEILLLDDSSSALDYSTDAALRKALRENHSQTTSLIIAQRVSSIAGCTHILVLTDGEPIGYGTHAELMENCEEYKTIALSQMGERSDV